MILEIRTGIPGVLQDVTIHRVGQLFQPFGKKPLAKKLFGERYINVAT
ncbi:hypothetical protein [uncultured Methanobacterium sp.]|nr:hypothetical protein [uncultured Methanobacterium sp.]